MPFFPYKQKKLFYNDTGEGPAILFIHPPGMGYKVLYKQRALTSTFRCIMPDLSGHGFSPFYKHHPVFIQHARYELPSFHPERVNSEVTSFIDETINKSG